MSDVSSSIKCGVRGARNVLAKDVLEEENVSKGKRLYTIRMQRYVIFDQETSRWVSRD